MWRFTRIVIFSVIIQMNFVYAQNMRFKHYDNTRELSHNSIRHIVQDKNGFLWLGTFDGLNRFDGYQFKPYLSSDSKTNTINNDDITALVIDADNEDMWIGTRNGLTLYQMNIGLFKTWLPQKNDVHSIPEAEIRAIYVDKYKRVWIGTKTKGLYIFNVDLNIFTKVGIEGFNYIKVIYEDNKGRIWVGSYDTGGVARITLDNFGRIIEKKQYSLQIFGSNSFNPYVNFIYEDIKEDIFIGTREGLYIYNELEEQFNTINIDKSKTDSNIGNHFNCVARAPDGKYWVGTLAGLLICDSLEDIAKGKYILNSSTLSDNTSLIDNLVSALYFDKSGVLWIGTQNGLDKYDPFNNQFKTLNDISFIIGDKVPRVSGFSMTYDNSIIISTHGDGLFIQRNGKIDLLYNQHKEIASIQTFDGNTFYCGLWNGKVLVINYDYNTAELINVGFDGIPIFSFGLLSTEKIIVGSFGQGAVILNLRDNSIDKSLNQLIPDYEINNILVDNQGFVWFATQNGILRYDHFQNSILKFENTGNDSIGVSNRNVYDLLIDKKGTLWAATRGGLNYYDPLLNDFKPVLAPDVLRKSWITDMVVDASDHVWLNMNNKIAQFTTSSKTVQEYYLENGNRLDIFNLGGFHCLDDSLIYMGGQRGIIYFSPQELKDDTVSLMPFISSFRIQNEEVVVGKEVNGQIIFKEDINKSKKVDLNFDNRNFSITFSSPSYVDERLNKFMYKLEGVDKEWNIVDCDHRNVQYTNLFYGDYDFKLRASNSHGYWSEAVSYNIKISPPFWLSYKAIMLYMVILAFAIYLTRKIILARLMLKQELILERVKREQHEMLNQEKLRFFTNISHELKTPLSLIIGPIKYILERGYSSEEELKKQHLLIQRNANRLLQLMVQMLDFRKASSGDLKLKVTHGDIKEHVKLIYDSFTSMARDKEINFIFRCPHDVLNGWIDWDKFDKILYNLLSNAFKYSYRGGQVIIKLHINPKDDTLLVAEVEDNGIGIDKRFHGKIFSRFFQVQHESEQNAGTGIGLSFVKKLIHLHHGKIWVESEPEKGSLFGFEIPIKNSAYNENEVFDLDSYIVKKNHDEDNIEAKGVLFDGKLKEKLLIVEDNLELRDFIFDYFSKFYKVYVAENGEVGLELCKEIKPVLVVADVMMPVMDGFTFCSKLKNDDEISHIPVILLTALAEHEKKMEGYKTGADDYLVKPFDPSLLKARIENLIVSRANLRKKYMLNAQGEMEISTFSPVDEIFIKKCMQVIEEYMTEPDLNVNFLCNKLNVSSSKLYRKLKALTDLSPNDFIRVNRLKKATQLLQLKQYNVAEVSSMVGFNDPLYFSRCFKKQFGFPPSKIK
ncbi:hybrid sensor histidine kinase/response regulator [Maribellus luteus]|uniref:histidine kinase n=1 Tax=Maribellus luteus TaxID=2305463 RepID=A0A399SWS1_9BACT|nr:hybrid sensor histidine kinase/response regulator transcription factor [Maribellus luteus]RIJ46467.1 hybrid sensor histidine kinase/response regulator [Maribellus luteus]